jgi:hypothetical protein
MIKITRLHFTLLGLAVGFFAGATTIKYFAKREACQLTLNGAVDRADVCIRALKLERTKDTNCTVFFENELDRSVVDMAFALNEKMNWGSLRNPPDLQMLEIVRSYRKSHPNTFNSVTVTKEVNDSFSLLGQPTSK